MTPQAVLIELLARVGARDGAEVFVSSEELSQWPAVAVAAMQLHKLLVPARPASSIVCPGCEQQCVMPVHTLPKGQNGPSSFIVCDKRDDINRVPVSTEGRRQWRCTADAVCGFVATSLGVRRSDRFPGTATLLNIGMACGAKRRQMLCLRIDGDLALVVADTTTPLAELVDYRDGEYAVDAQMVRGMVDAATTTDPRYTPSNAKREAHKLDTQVKYQSWQKAYRDLKRQHRARNMSDMWYARQIAKAIAHTRSVDTIRKHMKK